MSKEVLPDGGITWTKNNEQVSIPVTSLAAIIDNIDPVQLTLGPGSSLNVWLLWVILAWVRISTLTLTLLLGLSFKKTHSKMNGQQG